MEQNEGKIKLLLIDLNITLNIIFMFRKYNRYKTFDISAILKTCYVICDDVFFRLGCFKGLKKSHFPAVCSFLMFLFLNITNPLLDFSSEKKFKK